MQKLRIQGYYDALLFWIFIGICALMDNLSMLFLFQTDNYWSPS